MEVASFEEQRCFHTQMDDDRWACIQQVLGTQELGESSILRNRLRIYRNWWLLKSEELGWGGSGTKRNKGHLTKREKPSLEVGRLQLHENRERVPSPGPLGPLGPRAFCSMSNGLETVTSKSM